MKKTIVTLLSIIILLIIGVPIFFTWSNVPIENKSYGIPELLYYTMQIVGSTATAIAVIVALFGKEIRSMFFNEHCKLSLAANGFFENLGNTQYTANPIAQSYDCSLNIKNDGAKDISDMSLLLKEVHYKQTKEAKYKKIASFENKALYWTVPENTKTKLLLRDSRTIPLFKIYPEDSCQTPDRSAYSELRMRIIGCTLDKKYSKKGIWKTKYQLQSNEKVLDTFECTVEWNGNWCSRINEMADCLSAIIKRV